MKYHKSLGWVLIVLLGLPGCAYQSRESAGPEFLEPITVQESGFGVIATVAEADQGRERLKARRASRLDAYRNLAERVYGTVIYGGSTVNEFILENDLFRAYVDSAIRGAEVVAVYERSDGVIETLVALKLEPDFQACIANVSPVQATSGSCPLSMARPAGGHRVAPARAEAENLYFLE